MTNYMTPEREEYIAKLEQQIQVIDSILKMNSGTIVSAELRKKLKDFKIEDETVLQKLKNNEFEIAIVGLEKAGKSTFANALMENNLLPTKDPRCTFISTQIEYSGDNNDDSATVSFYTADEFDKDFKDKLRKLEFPDNERYSFDTIDEKQYLSIYESDEVSDEKKRLYGDSIHEDILAIIRNVDSLSKLFGKPDILFGASKIESGELDAYITDEAKARAVKQVVIRSKKLNEMKNAVIFDVPGFNSPTELHKIQTLERMKSADAIIVVANGISPSLTGESLKLLRESDDDGNPLNDKLFVFANKIEGARDIQKNIEDTIKEWTSKGFVKQSNKHRIIVGSALAHLQATGLDSDNRVLRSFKERENEMPHGDGIEAMRKALADYNENERFEVLKRRINRVKSDIMKAFNDILSSNKKLSTSRSYSAEQVAMVSELIDDTRPKAENNLLNLKDEIKTNFPTEKPLSEQIIQYITDNVTTERYGVSDDLLDEFRKKSQYIGTHDDVGRIEAGIRGEKFNEMYDDFSKDVIHIADKCHMEYSVQILNIILDSMGVDTNSPYRDELLDALKNEIVEFRSDLASDNHNNELYYQSLIERFSRYFYQILIESQYSAERLREFYDSIDDLYSLSIFYKKPDCEDNLAYINIAPKDQPFCMMLLFHYYLNASDNIRLFIDNVKEISGLKEIPDEFVKIAEKVYSVADGNIEAIIETISKKLPNLADKTDDFKINVLKQTLHSLAVKSEPCNVAGREGFTQYYVRYHNSLRGGKFYSAEDFKADFDDDIKILQDVLINAFVRAVSLEKPFVAREIKSIDDIIGYIKSKSFGTFLSANFRKIKYEETQILDKQHRENEQNIAIVDAIQSMLASLEN